MKIKLLYWEETAKYESIYSIDESVKRLQDIVNAEDAFFPKQRIKGKATRDYVRLYRDIPFVRNDIKPFFIGKFQQPDGKTVLKGAYSSHISVYIILCIWCSLFIIFPIFSAIVIIDSGKGSILDLWPFLLVSLLMIAGGILSVKICRRFSGNDIDYISKFIEDTLDK